MAKRRMARSEKAMPLRAACGAPTKLCTTTPMRTDRIIGLSTRNAGNEAQGESERGDARRQGEAGRKSGKGAEAGG